jgi:hypothetical protein
MDTWIFQANPKYYKIEKRLKDAESNPIIIWSVTQCVHDIKRGDQVFIWRSGSRAGMIGVAKILCDPVRILDQRTERKYQIDHTRETVSMCVVCEIEQTGFLPRYAIKKIKGLASLSILKNPRGTNFVVTSSEANLLLEKFRPEAGLETGARRT